MTGGLATVILAALSDGFPPSHRIDRFTGLWRYADVPQTVRHTWVSPTSDDAVLARDRFPI